MVAARGMLTVTIPGLAQTGELVARAVFAIRKNLVSLDSFIAELRAAKLIADSGLTPEELLLVKDAFTRARTLATDEKWVAELEKAMSKRDWSKVKDLVESGVVPLKPENAYLRGQEHGISWQQSDAIKRANETGLPQGKWGNKNDLEYAGKQAAKLKPEDGMTDFPINPDHKCIVYYADGSTSIPDMIRVKNIGNGKFHGFPIDSKTAEPIYKK